MELDMTGIETEAAAPFARLSFPSN